MKSKLASLFLTLFLTNSLWAFTTTPFTAKLSNHTGIPTENISITFRLACYYDIIVDQYHCGEKEVTVTPNNDGTFEVPAIRLSPGLFKEKYIHSSFRITINGTTNLITFKTDKENSCHNDPSCRFENKKSLLQSFTLIKTPALKIIPHFQSGISPIDFYRESDTKKIFLKVQEEFMGQQQNLDSQELSLLGDNSSFKLNTPIHFLPGIVGASESIKIKMSEAHSLCSVGQYNNSTTIEYSLAEGYTQDGIKIDSYELLLDDLKFGHKNESCITSLKILQGKYAPIYEIGSISNAQECFFKADLNCHDGIVSGQIALMRSFDHRCPIKEELPPTPVSGICDYDTASINFEFNGQLLGSKLQPNEHNRGDWIGEVIDQADGVRTGKINFRFAYWDYK